MNVAFIPVRGGSKSIPLKNIKIINGRPLVYWTVRAACGCMHIDRVYVATDSDQIKQVILQFAKEETMFEKLQVIGRSAQSASDTASTESAMLEFAAQYEFENIVLVQATSPLLMSSDLDNGFMEFAREETDSVLSVVRQKRFHWALDEEGFAKPTNYDVFHRPRRQEFDGYLVENGAFYITSREALLQSQNRISGHIKAVEMNEDTFFEIDEPADWLIIEALMKKNKMTAPRPRLSQIKMFLTDCDGCLTDAGMYYTEQGDELKKFNARDGAGFALLREAGIITGIITGEDRQLNQRRAEKLKLDILVGGCLDKVSAVRELCQKYQIMPEQIAYIGDDLNDLGVMQMVGFCACPADAVYEVRESADYVTEAVGGRGVIREVAELILAEHEESL